MARLPRFNLPGLPQHVIQRGNNKQTIFRARADYIYYLNKLSQAAVEYQCHIHAYVLMTNHVHLLVTPQTNNGISKMMQVLGRYYVQFYNHKHNRTGTLWEGRYKATLIDTEQYLLTCMRYIELNPVRATAMVKNPGAYPWSSYHCNALGKFDSLVTAHQIYLGLAASKTERQIAYKKLFNLKLDDRVLTSIRDATNKAWVLGDSQFKNKIARKLNRATESKGHGGDRKSKNYQDY